MTDLLTAVADRVPTGTLMGPYEVVAFIGEGGMGEVYRARDTRLDRDVALKILPGRVSDDPRRRERFMREAWILSSLNHPHVCGIHDLGEWHGRAFLVMELADGEGLDVRIARRPLPLQQALSIGVQIADALDAAHRRGFVHRDLKPGNIIITTAGIKLLDFGIAKLWNEPLAPADQSNATTASDAGSIPGTTAYIAPEQLEGRPADPRSDLFAFGVVLYEMISGRRPFASETKAGLIAAILEKTPPPVTTPAGEEVPPALERLIAKCLEKDPNARWQTARDLSSELTWIAHQLERLPVPPPAAAPPSRWLGVTTALVLLTMAAAGAAVWWNRGAPAVPPAVFRFVVTPPAGVLMAGSAAFALSPDGKYLAFAGSSGGGPSLLWIQSLDSYNAQPIVGSDDAWHPFWSPDSRSVGFFAGQKLKAVNRADGTIRTLADLPNATRSSHGAWGDGVIILTAGASLLRLNAEGGTPTLLIGPDSPDGRRAGYWHRFLPDGRRFLLRAEAPRPGGPNIFVGSVDGGPHVPLLNTDSQVDYVDPGYLLFMRNGDLLAQRFDPATLRLSGEPVDVPEPVSLSSRLSRAMFSASRSGVLAYEAEATLTQLTWFNRVGQRIGILGQPGLYANPALSPDGTRVLVSRLDPSVNTSDIWLIDEAMGERAVTSDRGVEDYPVWSPDGRRLVFASDRTGSLRMYEKAADAPAVTADAALLPDGSTGADANWPMDWGGGNAMLLFQGGGRAIPRKLVGFDTTKPDAVPTALFSTPPPGNDLQEAAQARISPDGKWIAYVAGLGRSPQVFVKPFAGGSALAQVSVAGGFEPKWRGDGRELFYLSPDRTLMSVETSCRDTCTFGTPKSLFRVASLGTPLRKGAVRNEYDVTADGSRFLVNEPVEGVSAYAIRVVVNWPASAALH